jgi:hypothetical protein
MHDIFETMYLFNLVMQKYTFKNVFVIESVFWDLYSTWNWTLTEINILLEYYYCCISHIAIFRQVTPVLSDLFDASSLKRSFTGFIVRIQIFYAMLFYVCNGGLFEIVQFIAIYRRL